MSLVVVQIEAEVNPTESRESTCCHSKRGGETLCLPVNVRFKGRLILPKCRAETR
jgi:hypothetical protein